MSYFRGHPHSTYAQKSPKLDPPTPLYTIIHTWPPPPLTFMRTYFLYIHPLPHPPPNKFLFKFKFSSLTISRLEIYIKKISMVSIHSLRPVYTFLYTIINGNVITTFVQQKKSNFVLVPLVLILITLTH